MRANMLTRIDLLKKNEFYKCCRIPNVSYMYSEV